MTVWKNKREIHWEKPGRVKTCAPGLNRSSTGSIPVPEWTGLILAMFVFYSLVLLDDFLHGGSWEPRVRIVFSALFILALGGYKRRRTVAVRHVNGSISERPAVFINLGGNEIGKRTD